MFFCAINNSLLPVAIAQLRAISFPEEKMRFKEKKMSGTLTYGLNHIPKIDETVYLVVEGKSFPTGIWRGRLTFVGDSGDSQGGFYDPTEYHTMCEAEITDDRISPVWRNREPQGSYSVFPGAPGLETLLNKLNDQKSEVKALKKELDLLRQIFRDVFQDIIRCASSKSEVRE